MVLQVADSQKQLSYFFPQFAEQPFSESAVPISSLIAFPTLRIVLTQSAQFFTLQMEVTRFLQGVGKKYQNIRRHIPHDRGLRRIGGSRTVGLPFRHRNKYPRSYCDLQWVFPAYFTLSEQSAPMSTLHKLLCGAGNFGKI